MLNDGYRQTSIDSKKYEIDYLYHRIVIAIFFEFELNHYQYCRNNEN